MLLLPSARAAATIGRGANSNANGIIYTPTEMNLLGATRKYRKKDMELLKQIVHRTHHSFN
jgi:hypothetical protein